MKSFYTYCEVTVPPLLKAPGTGAGSMGTLGGGGGDSSSRGILITTKHILCAGSRKEGFTHTSHPPSFTLDVGNLSPSCSQGNKCPLYLAPIELLRALTPCQSLVFGNKEVDLMHEDMRVTVSSAPFLRYLNFLSVPSPQPLTDTKSLKSLLLCEGTKVPHH